MFKVIIAGGRTFEDYEYLKKVCDFLLANRNESQIEIVSGNARGADALGEKYSKERGYKLTLFKADWNKHGKKAGYLRNKQMAEYADAAIIFWDGESRGTKSMIDLATEHKLKLRVSNINQ